MVPLNDPVALCLVAYCAKRAPTTVLCPIPFHLLDISRFGFSGCFLYTAHLLPHRTIVGVRFFIIVKVVRMKRVFFMLFIMLLFMEVVVLYKSSNVFIL